jgi:NAD(P)-dependent dehydrogenase (short-subunit alcohol dehydrogenase family)
MYYGSITALRHFIPRKTGKLINILGRGDRQPVPMQNAYASSKAWLRNFTLALARETKATGVGVFAFNPGMMQTELMQKVEVISGYEKRLAVLPVILRMWSKPPEEPAERAVWLASKATDGRTGLIIQEMSPAGMIKGTLSEAYNRLTRRASDPMQVDVTLVPRTWDEEKTGRD